MPRFFTGRGDFVGINRLPNAFRSTAQALRRRCFGIYPELPWIPFAAIPRMERLLTPDSFVWEIGAGMSTLWLSARAKKVVSIEASAEWFEKLGGILRQKNVANVDLRFEWIADRMSAYPGVKETGIDLLFIDGGPRHDCLFHGFDQVKAGGYIYLDNWDVAVFWPGAEEFLQARSAEIESSERFIDYVPGSFFVNDGLLIRKKC